MNGRRGIVTLTTDFGLDGGYVAQMKGVLLSINPQLTLVDLSHAVPPGDIRRGAIILADCAERFPADAIHVAVIDPGVGTARRLLYARFDEQQFLAPDNGLLSRLAASRSPDVLVALENREYWLDEVSATFHGRDILAPVAAYLSLGIDADLLGPRCDGLELLDWPAPRIEPGKIAGEILDVDSFGNLRTNIAAINLTAIPTHCAVTIRCGGHTVAGLSRTYGDHANGVLVALVGSGGYLELAVVNGSAAARLCAGHGDPVTVAW